MRQLNSSFCNAYLLVLTFLHVLRAFLSQQTRSVLGSRVRYRLRSGFVFHKFVFPGTLELHGAPVEWLLRKLPKRISKHRASLAHEQTFMRILHTRGTENL